MKEDYTQPFWVGWNNPRFPYACYGYMPPEEEKGEGDLTDRVKVLEERVSLIEQTEPSPHRWGTQYLTPRQCDIINQVKSGYLYLLKKVEELTVSRKTKGNKDNSYIYSSISKSEGEAKSL